MEVIFWYSKTMEDIGVIFYVLSFISGFMSLLTPGGIVFSFFIFGLPILGVFLKEKILIYVSLLIIGVVFFFHLTIAIPFIPQYIGPIAGVLITAGNYLWKLIFNSGFMFLPLIVSLVSLKLLNRKDKGAKV